MTQSNKYQHRQQIAGIYHELPKFKAKLDAVDSRLKELNTRLFCMQADADRQRCRRNRLTKLLTILLVVLIVAMTAQICRAGTVDQQAAASLAVARARITLADQNPALPDSGNRYRSAAPLPPSTIAATVPTLSQTWQQVEDELASTKAALETAHEEIGQLKAAQLVPIPVEETVVAAAMPTIRSSGPMSITFTETRKDPIVAGAAQGDKPGTLPAQLIVRTWARGCPAGERTRREILEVLPRLGWSIGESPTSQIMFETGNQQTEGCPIIILKQRGREVRRWTEYTDPGTLSTALRGAWDSVQEPFNEPAQGSYQATGKAGSINASGPIKQMFDWQRTYVGERVPMTLSWSRSGQQTFPLMAKSDWTPLAVLGNTGTVSVSARGSNKLPFDEIGFQYRLAGDDLFIDAGEIKFGGALKRFSIIKSVKPDHYNAQPYGLFVIDDMVAYWSIFSAFKGIAELLWPTVDLLVPGQVSMTSVLVGDELTVDFQQSPTVKMQMLFSFSLNVSRVVVTPTNVHIEFTGSRWIKSRDFAVQ